MAKKISPQDLFTEIDIFAGIRDSADKTITKMNSLQEEMKQTATVLKESVGGAKFDSSKEIAKFTKNTKEALKLTQEFEKTQKSAAVAEQQRQKALQQAEITKQKANRTQETAINLKRKQAQENERLAKQQLKSKKLIEDESNAYKKLVKNTRDLKNESKKLGAEMLHLEQSGKKNSAEYRKLSKTYDQVTNAARKGDNQLKKLDKRVGDNFRNVGNYRAGLGKLQMALGSLGIAFGLAGIVRNVAGTIVNFDQAVADLAAISGKSKEELKGLNEQAKKLGATTQFTAIEITNMQIELAKLGFTTQEIDRSTKAVANFAAATGADIPAAAKVAGSALRGFGLEASEMERVVSVLGVATTKSGLDFAAYESSFSKIAPVAKQFGFSIEDTTALLGQLATAGFDASSAATATRNILLKLADANGDLAQELGRPIKSADDLAEGLQELVDKGIDLNKALELTDRRSVAAFGTFLQGADTLVDFRDSITDVNDELQAMADKRLDSVQGKLTLLSSAWDGFILSMGDSIMASEGLKTSLAFLGENLELIMNTIGKLIRAFVVYKTTLMLLRVAQRLYNTDFSSLGKQMAAQIPMTRAYRLEQIKLARGTKQASAAVKGFGKAFASIAIFAIIMAITELATAWYDVASGAKAARLEEESRNMAMEMAEISAKNLANANAARLKLNNQLLEDKFKIVEKTLRTQKLAAKDADEERKLEIAAMNEKFKIVVRMRDNLKSGSGPGALPVKDRIEKLKNELIPFAQSDLSIATQLQDHFQKIYNEQEIHLTFGATDEATADLFGVKAQVAGERAALNTLQGELASLQDEQITYNEMVEEYWLLYQEALAAETKATDQKKKNNKVSRVQNVLLKEKNRYLSRQKELLQELLEIEQDRAIIQKDKEIDTEFNAQLKIAQETGDFDATNLNTLLDEKYDMTVANIDQRVAYEQQAEQDQYDRAKAIRSTQLTEERTRKIAEAKKKGLAVKDVEDFYDTQRKNLEDDEIKRAKDLASEQLIIFEEGENAKLEAKEDQVESFTGYMEELEGAEEDFLSGIADKYKEKYNEINQIVQLATDYFIKQSQRKIDQINKEIDAAQKQFDYLKTLAAEGNINAEQSLAEQQKIINEANKRKLKQERFQAQIQLASSAYQTYNQKLASGSTNALSDTIADITLLQTFVNSLPTFLEGTEDTGINGRGIDGKGGFHAVLHPNERVIPKHLNQKLSGITNRELSNLAMDYKINKNVSGNMINQDLIANHSMHNLTNKITELTQVVKNKPETNIELGEITSSLMEIVKTRKVGNTLTYNKFKVRK